MYQKITLVGHLGRDPEMRFTPTGQAISNFSVATGRKHTDQSGKLVDETVWFKITAWGKLAETCNNYLSKGKLVLIEGRLSEPKPWTDKEGNTRVSLQVTASTVKFLSTKDENNEQTSDDDTPF